MKSEFQGALIFSAILKTRSLIQTKGYKETKNSYAIRTGLSLICGEQLYKMDITAVSQQRVLLCIALKKIFWICHKQVACLLSEETQK